MLSLLLLGTDDARVTQATSTSDVSIVQAYRTCPAVAATATAPRKHCIGPNNKIPAAARRGRPYLPARKPANVGLYYSIKLRCNANIRQRFQMGYTSEAVKSNSQCKQAYEGESVPPLQNDSHNWYCSHRVAVGQLYMLFGQFIDKTKRLATTQMLQADRQTTDGRTRHKCDRLSACTSA